MKRFMPSKLPLSYVLTIVFSIIFIFFGNRLAGQKVFAEQDTEFIRARVQEIVSVENDNEEGESDFAFTTVTFKAKALGGSQRGDILRCTQTLDSLYALSVPQVQERDTVLLEHIEAGDNDSTGGGQTGYVLIDFVRTGPLIWLTALFALLVILFGRKKGANTLLSFVFSLSAIFLVLVPALLNGHNIYAWSLVICVYIVVSNLLVVQGPSAKSLAAGLGCLGGVLCSGLIILLVNRPMYITGLLDDETIYLKDMGIDIKGIVFCMILIGSMGALMDMAMDIAAALHEVKEKKPDITAGELMRSGINIGQDLIGTMANTLILAYIGESMSFLLVMIYFSANTTHMLNREIIAVALLQCIAGCLSLLAVVPLTALFCSMFYMGKAKTVWYDDGDHNEKLEP